MRKSLKIWLFALLALSVAISSAQSMNCPDIVSQALEAVENFCTELGRNQACYGNVQLSAQAQPNVQDFVFADTGDIANVGDILSLDLSPLDANTGNWGVAVMALQVDIPNTLPGQNVTFILFGDVEIENAASAGQNPMQAFYLRTGIGAPACEEAPESGLLMQTPEGIENVNFNINGVDVKIGSTVLFQSQAISETENEMIISTVEGTATVNFDTESYPAIEGTLIRLPLNSELLPTGRPSLPEAYEEGRFDNLPIDPLPRDIEIAPPLENIAQLQDRLSNGLPPCGAEGLPACEDLPSYLRVGNTGRWGRPFSEGQNCIARPLELVNATDLPPVIGATNPFPFCPAQDRASRPQAPENIVLALDGDEDLDGIPNIDDACPFIFGTSEFQGCPERPVDSDGDGLSDGLDLCPYRAGANRGCPEAPSDSDSDGIADALDACPREAGVASLRGCPEPDRDGDGFPDARDACPSVYGTASGCPPDSDRDGVADSNDQCPNEFGIAERNGCPAPSDADGDGITDTSDRCPNEFGIAERNGCPMPSDIDRDGIADSEDECPDRAGTAEFSGCPAPDTDGDGVPDNQDQCPREIGTTASSGCPLTDSDKDGVYDYQDQCPTVFGSVDYLGCPPDADGDGVADSQDRCPNDFGDSANYGCPVLDTDGDTVPDSQDQCPTVAGSPNNSGCPLR